MSSNLPSQCTFPMPNCIQQFSNTCRICFNQQQLSPIINHPLTENKTANMSSLFHLLLHVEIETDGMPQNICNSCAIKMLEFYDFYVQCKYAEQLFKSISRKTLVHKAVQNAALASDNKAQSLFELHSLQGTENIIALTATSDTNFTSHGGNTLQQCFNTCKQETGTTHNDLLTKTVETQTILDHGLLARQDKNSPKYDIVPDERSNVKTYAQLRCGRSKKLESNLKRHKFHLYNGGRRYLCLYCSRTFYFKCALIRHYEDHTDIRSGSSPKKQLASFNCLLRQRRVSQPHRISRYKCPNCECVFQYKVSLSRHQRQEHALLSPLQPQLPFSSKINERLSAVDDNSNPLCVDKNSNMTDNCDLSNSFKSKLNSFECTSSPLYQLEPFFHLVNRPFRCIKCKREFTRKDTLLKHVWTHTDQKPFQCQHCNKSFIRKHLLKEHEWRHTGHKPFKCELCKQYFSRKSTLDDHLSAHSGNNFTCTACNRIFSRKSSYIRHLRMHRNNAWFQCEFCGRDFALKHTLQSHIRIHTGEKPYKCNVCNCMFAQKSTLRTHVRRHTGEKPFQCSKCNETFSVKSTLMTHMRGHTGERPYQCEHCGNTYARSSSLRKHERAYKHLEQGKSTALRKRDVQ